MVGRFAVPLAVAGALLSSGCGQPPHVTDCAKTNMRFSQMKTEILKFSCVFSSCHNASSHMNSLDLESDPYAALVNVQPVNAKAKSMGWKRVVPNSEETSFMWKKVMMRMDEDPKTGFGKSMPDTGQYLDDESLDQLVCWIRRGAPND